MTAYVALLRAVNVGGTGKLPMAKLKQLCEELGFEQVQTYIASGNVVFQARLHAAEVQKKLQHGLTGLGLKDPQVLVRTAAELREVVNNNPFPDSDPKRTIVLFLDSTPAADADKNVRGLVDEQIALGKRELYVAYSEAGVGRSKLVLPAARQGTGRNLNTVRQLLKLAEERLA